MRTGRTLSYIVTFAVSAFLSFPSHAILINLVPSSTAISTGTPVNVDVVVSGLGSGVPPSVGAFDLNVAFNSAILDPLGVSFGLFLGDPTLLEALTSFDLGMLGIVDFAEVSLLSPADLDALQPDSFTLATLSFVGLGSGTNEFKLVGKVRVVDAFGNPLEIPEPATITLLSVGMAMFGYKQRRRLV